MGTKKNYMVGFTVVAAIFCSSHLAAQTVIADLANGLSVQEAAVAAIDRGEDLAAIVSALGTGGIGLRRVSDGLRGAGLNTREILAALLDAGSTLGQARNIALPRELRELCLFIDARVKEPSLQGRYEWTYQVRILQAAGVAIGTDDEAAIAKKVSRLWMENEESLTCDILQFDVKDGSVIKFAIASFFDEFIDDVIRWNVGLNRVDSWDSRTVLDYVKYMIEKNMGNSLEPKLHGYYEKLRAAGALHAFELANPPPSTPSVELQVENCLRQERGDEPGEAATYTGGLNENLSALTPAMVPGGTRVSVRQAACLTAAYGDDLFIIGTISDDVGLPGAIKFPFVGYSGNFDDQYQQVSAQIAAMAGDKPILVYCHNPQCFLSYNAVLRLSRAGAKKIYWLRDGLTGWQGAGHPTMTPDSFLYRRAIGQ